MSDTPIPHFEPHHDQAVPPRADAGQPGRPRRADLHCHSVASTEADEAVLMALRCPECYSEPGDVYAQAVGRGMDFVTITDHDSLGGVAQLQGRSNVITGEEVTCYFPEDGCKMHILVWGLSRDDHDALQARAQDIYDVAAYLEEHNLAHAVAHALYRQNDKLERWHLERLILLFKGFEGLNGAHSLLHRTALEPVLDALTPDLIEALARRHGIEPRWPRPWEKSRTGGSDDHGLLNIGRTWTEFPPEVTTVEQVLSALREGRCRPGGEAGSSLKLAHNFFGVGIRYYTRQVAGATSRRAPARAMLEMLVGERTAPRKRDLFKAAVGHGARAVGRRIRRPLSRPPQRAGTALLTDLFVRACQTRSADAAPLAAALRRGEAPLGQHEDVFRFISAINRDVAAGIAGSITRGLHNGELAPLFDALSAITAQQFVMLPYYFALFHQNRERHLLPRITGRERTIDAASLNVGLFTDTFDEINGVGRFLRRMGARATTAGRSLAIQTCNTSPQRAAPFRSNFAPLASVPLPFYPELTLALPPVAEVMEAADRRQFDAVHVSTPGPMGLCGWLVAKMLHVPLLATYHTDLPAFVRDLTGDHRLSAATTGYMRWFYGQADVVFARTRQYESSLEELGVARERIMVLPPSTDTHAFHPRHRDPALWQHLGVREPYRLLYAGRVSAEKNLGVLVEAFRQLRQTRTDVALVVVGDGPYAETMRRDLAGLPAYFLGYQGDASLAALYASSDLFVFPSQTDTLGQVVIEAQASGLPVLVSDRGGPQDVMDDGVTGLVLPATAPHDWASAIDELLDDTPRRCRMARTAPQRVARFENTDDFEAFWAEHLKAATRKTAAAAAEPTDAPVPDAAGAPAGEVTAS